MNNKKVKKFVSCVCALTLLLGAIPMDFIKAEAEESTVKTTYYDVNEDNPLQLHGVSYDETEKIFKRMDLDTAASIAGVDRAKYKFVKESYDEDTKKTTYSFSNNVYSHAREAAGGRIRFSTDSAHVSIQATLQNWYYAYAKAMGDGKYGFDVYVDTEEGSSYAGTISVREYPTTDGRTNAEDGLVQVEGTLEFDTAEMRNLTIYFPITIETKSVKVGVETGSTIAEHAIPYEENQKIVFYGSSITQGGAVTKPGNTYVNTVGRNLNMEYHSFGMWGSAKGQIAFAQYIVNNMTDMTAFVFDYDHNNSTVTDLDGSKIPDTKPVEWTEGEYWQFYQTIRTAYPNIPIIMVTRPNNHLDVLNAEEPDDYSTASEMKAFIRAAYEKAVAEGDENVHFVDGEAFFGYSTGYLADTVHPNDAGQARMAEVMTAVLEKALAGEKNLCVLPQEDCKEEKTNEDFTFAADEELADRWTISTSNLAENKIQLTEVDGNPAMQLAYKRQTGKTPVGYIQHKTAILRNIADFELEWDSTLYKNTNLNKWPYFGSVYRDSASKGTYEARVQLTNSGYKVSIIDNSDFETDDKPTYEVTIPDATLKEKLSSRTELSVHTKVKVDTVIVGNGEKMLVFTVSVEGGTAVIDIVPESMNCSPTGLRMHMYGGSNSDATEEDYKIIVDNIKLSKTTRSNTLDMVHTLQSVAEVPATIESIGMKAHYECTVCGEKYLDAEGVVKANDENLAIAKLCALIDEDFENGTDNWTLTSTVYEQVSFDTVEKTDGTAIGQLQYTRGKSGTAYIQYDKGVLNGKSDFVLEMDEVSIFHSPDTKRWANLGIMFRQRAAGGESAKTLEFRIQGSNTGLSIVPYYNGEKYSDSEYSSLGYIKITDAECGEAYVNKDGTPLMFDLRLEVSGVGSDAITCTFTVGTQTKQLVIPNFDCEPTGLRINLYGGANADVDQVYKATFDNIRINTASHTIKKVEKVESTEENAGTKEHYACEDCGKKFSNSTGTQEVTEGELQYAALPEIKYQTRENDRGLTDIRFVAYVGDYKQYQSVTFKITLTANGKSGTAECKTVYKTIIADDIRYTTEDIYGADGYFAAFKLLNNTTANLDEKMQVDVTWKDLNGNEKTSTRTITVSEGLR